MAMLTNQTKTWALILSIVVGSAIGWWWLSRSGTAAPTSIIAIHQASVPASLGTHMLNIEIVQTPEAITQGLSDRPELGSDGMLFVLGETRVPRFWMKDMQFDLDFIWLLDNKVIEITPNAPHPVPGTPTTQLLTYSPHQPANQVLEVNAGNAQKWGIAVGDQLEIK